MVGLPNKPMGFPMKNDHDLGCEMGVFPPFKETPIYQATFTMDFSSLCLVPR